jgi:hypothetical protein
LPRSLHQCTKADDRFIVIARLDVNTSLQLLSPKQILPLTFLIFVEKIHHLTFDQWCLAGNENDFQSRVAWI